jgi:hypothetical protein
MPAGAYPEDVQTPCQKSDGADSKGLPIRFAERCKIFRRLGSGERTYPKSASRTFAPRPLSRSQFSLAKTKRR